MNSGVVHLDAGRLVSAFVDASLWERRLWAHPSGTTLAESFRSCSRGLALEEVVKRVSSVFNENSLWTYCKPAMACWCCRKKRLINNTIPSRSKMDAWRRLSGAARRPCTLNSTLDVSFPDHSQVLTFFQCIFPHTGLYLLCISKPSSALGTQILNDPP